MRDLNPTKKKKKGKRKRKKRKEPTTERIKIRLATNIFNTSDMSCRGAMVREQVHTRVIEKCMH